MIGIGWTEMLVIGVVALIFIGPKELPALMQKMGKAIGAIRRMGSEFQREINRSTGLDQITDLRRSITEPLKKTTAEIAREFNKITPTGVQPTGAIKPADPKAQSVVTEIRAAAGLETPAAPVKSAPVSTGPVKAARRVKPAPTTPVVAADLPAPISAQVPEPVAKTPVRVAAKPVESPAPIEALAPAKPARKRAPKKPKPQPEAS